MSYPRCQNECQKGGSIESSSVTTLPGRGKALLKGRLLPQLLGPATCGVLSEQGLSGTPGFALLPDGLPKRN